MEINAYLLDKTYLALSNGAEFKIPIKLARILIHKGIKINYKYKKEVTMDGV